LGTNLRGGRRKRKGKWRESEREGKGRGRGRDGKEGAMLPSPKYFGVEPPLPA